MRWIIALRLYFRLQFKDTNTKPISLVRVWRSCNPWTSTSCLQHCFLSTLQDIYFHRIQCSFLAFFYSTVLDVLALRSSKFHWVVTVICPKRNQTVLYTVFISVSNIGGFLFSLFLSFHIKVPLVWSSLVAVFIDAGILHFLGSLGPSSQCSQRPSLAGRSGLVYAGD